MYLSLRKFDPSATNLGDPIVISNFRGQYLNHRVKWNTLSDLFLVKNTLIIKTEKKTEYS